MSISADPSNMNAVDLEISWSRLQAAIDEAEVTLVRTAFSPLIREAFDFGVVLLDLDGGSVVQSRRSMPSFVGTMPQTLKAGLELDPPLEWQPGDVVATNDPWLGTGHLPDVTMLRPIFRGERIVAFVGTIAHWADMGGRLWSAESTELYEEGLRLPLSKLVREDRINTDLVDVIAANVRLQEEVLGDMHAQIAALKMGERRLTELLDAMDVDDPAALFALVQTRTEQAMRAAIEQVPDGVYRHEVEIDGVDEYLTLKAAVEVNGDTIHVDWTGSSPQVARGINETYNHAYAMTSYPLKCALCPEVPNNDGAYRPIKMTAEPGSIVNAKFPAPVNARQMIGHYLSAVIFGALSEVLPTAVLADSGSPAPRVLFSGSEGDGKRYGAMLTLSGGMGAHATRDGLSATPFPSNAGATSAEVIEARTPLLFRERTLVADSGGAGRQRGGLGVATGVELVGEGTKGVVSVMTDRVEHPPLGRRQGGAGSPNVIKKDGRDIDPKAQTLFSHGELLWIATAGGGGFGAPKDRDPALLRRDVAFGYVSPTGARVHYGAVSA